MTGWLYVDEFSTMESTPADEYDEIEKLIRAAVPGTWLFTRDVRPHELRNGAPDVYVFDIGGMCAVDFSGTRRDAFAREVVAQVDEHPSTLFVPYTMMTRRHVAYALSEHLPEMADKDDDAKQAANDRPGTLRPNVWCLGRSDEFLPGAVESEQIAAALQAWFRGRARAGVSTETHDLGGEG